MIDNNKIPLFLKSEYIILTLLGEGGCATVYMAYSIIKKKYVAIKVQSSKFYNDAVNENAIINVLNGISNVFITLFDSFQLNLNDNNDITYFLVFELLACTVFNLIKKGKYYDGLPYNMVQKIILQTIESLNIMNNCNMVHSDIKPENIMVVGISDNINKIIQYVDSLNLNVEYKKLLKTYKNNVTDPKLSELYLQYATDIFNITNNMYNCPNDNIDDNINDSVASCRIPVRVASCRIPVRGDDNINNNTVGTYFSRSLISVSCHSNSDSDSDSNSDSDSDSNSNSDSDSNSNSNSDSDYVCIDEKYISDIKIKLIDFGGSYYIDNKPAHPIQTLYYKSPDHILHYNSNDDCGKCDIWAIGCLTYELITGEILFDPNYGIGNSNSNSISNNNNCMLRLILKNMCEILGPIPKYLIDKSKKKDIFYRHDYTIKGINKYNANLLKYKLKSKLNDKLSLIQFDYVYDFLINILQYDLNDRYSLSNCLNHPFLKQLS